MDWWRQREQCRANIRISLQMIKQTAKAVDQSMRGGVDRLEEARAALRRADAVLARRLMAETPPNKPPSA